MKYARFVVPYDEKVILGFQFSEMFEPQTVYEVKEFLGELVIRKVGPSMLQENKLRYQDCNTIVENGNHLLTIEEYKRKCELQNTDIL